MEKTNDGGPVFPSEYWNKKDGLEYTHPGMTLRDYLAGQAILGISFSTKNILELHDNNVYTTLAIMAYRTADAMLKERAK